LALNHTYWRGVFLRTFCKEIHTLVEVLEQRVLPGFNSIEQESEKITSDAWDSFMSAPATGEEDPAEFAEAAQEIGIEHYFLMTGMRQGVTNLFAAALYHLFEQQLMLFHRRQLLHPGEENDSSLFNQKEIEKRLEPKGIVVSTFVSWPIVQELRLLANTVKHAEGASAMKLQETRPDMFKAPGLPGMGEWDVRIVRRIFQPLSGKDVFVSIENVHEFRDSLCQFWNELIDAMSADA